MKKLSLILAIAAVCSFGFTSCKGYDTKECDKLAEKIEDDDLKGKDYEDIIDQLDGILSYCEDMIEEIDEQESKSDRCDKFEELMDTDEFSYCLKFSYALQLAKEKDELKGVAKTEYKDKEIKSRFKKVAKKMDKLAEKCDENQDYYKVVREAVGSVNNLSFDEED